MASGKKPFFLKKSEKKRLELLAKYKELKDKVGGSDGETGALAAGFRDQRWGFETSTRSSRRRGGRGGMEKFVFWQQGMGTKIQGLSQAQGGQGEGGLG